MTETTKKIEDFAADAQKTVAEQMDKVSKGVEDATSFNQESVDAVMKVANTAMKSVEEMNSEVISFSKKTVEEGVAAAKEIAASKNVLEAFEKQADFAKVALDGYFAQVTRMNELAMTASKDAMEPVAARMSAAAEMVKGYSA